MKPRRIVITGATRGLGRAMVERLIDAGHSVAGCGRSTTDIAALSDRFGANHLFQSVDVTDDEQVAAFARDAMDRIGCPDLLVNNAGIINANAPLWQVPAADFLRLMDVNVVGVANVIRHFVPGMIAQGSGVIVNFSSGWGRSTSPEVAPYCASKWAIEGLTQALAQELPDGLTAVPLNPGIINTDMLQRCFGSMASQHRSADEWAATAVPFLLSIGPQHNGRPLTAP